MPTSEADQADIRRMVALILDIVRDKEESLAMTALTMSTVTILSAKYKGAALVEAGWVAQNIIRDTIADVDRLRAAGRMPR